MPVSREHLGAFDDYRYRAATTQQVGKLATAGAVAVKAYKHRLLEPGG